MNSKYITIDGFEDMTAQQVFDLVAVHLIRQNRRSVSGDVGGSHLCVYQSSDGLQCAAGILIKPEHRADSNGGWQSLVFARLVPESNKDLIVSLQAIHDNYTPEAWPLLLHFLAREQQLVCLPLPVQGAIIWSKEQFI